MSLYNAGSWEEARTIFQALVVDDPENIQITGYLGVLAARRGDRAEAERISTWLATVDRPYVYGRPALWRARIAAVLGEKESAVVLLREALARGYRPLDIYLHRELDFEELRKYPPFQELIRPRG